MKEDTFMDNSYWSDSLFPQFKNADLSIIETETSDAPIHHVWASEQFKILKSYI